MLLWTYHNPHYLSPCTTWVGGRGRGIVSEGVKLTLVKKGEWEKVLFYFILFFVSHYPILI